MDEAREPMQTNKAFEKNHPFKNIWLNYEMK